MKFYKDPANTVFAYEADGSQDSIIPADQVPITQAEADALRFPVPTLAQRVAAAILKIDADADAIRDAVLGGRTTEYQAALNDAQAFQAAGFAGTLPPGVQSWLDAKTAVGAGWTAQQAAQDILDTGAAWDTAQNAIRSNRLLRKEQVKVATAPAAIDTAMANWAGFVAAIRTQLGLPQG